MIILTLTIGVLNVCLGYAVAVFLGYGPPGLLEAWEALTGESASAYDSVEPFSGLPQQLAATPLELMLDDASGAESEIQPYYEPYDDNAAEFEQVALDAPEHWDLNEKYIETSILKLNIAMMKSGARATELDTRLRECMGQSSPEIIRECLEKLQEDCEAYLEEQAENAERFRQRVGELGELKDLGDEIEMANLDQAAQVETTLNNLKYMDFGSDLEAANARLREEIGNLRVARHHLRDEQEVAFLAIARYEDRIDKIEKQLFTDPLTKLRNRIGLEELLWQWWQQKRHHTRQMSAALFDLDDYGGLNERHGSLVGDRILYEVAQFVLRSAGKADTVARYAGQRFVVLMIDTGPRQAVKLAETIRQSVEHLIFQRDGSEIRLTTCVGLTEVRPADGYMDVFNRLEAAVRHAKHLGPNRGSQCEPSGAGLQAIESPGFGIQDTEIVI
ncbi:MAG: diguanylate cyclase [Thermoguttaceae bacterium]|jgi:diguanylate cyclase (GGDEF)-like protein|nr:diguanylate cyclase [Thermoguttaceae bacterium]